MQIGANVDRVGRIDGAVAFLNVLYFPLLIDHEGCPAGELGLFVEDSISLRDFPLHVAQQGKFDSDLFREGGVGRWSVDADAKDFGVIQVDLSRVDTSLVSLKFLGSTGGESQNVEC